MNVAAWAEGGVAHTPFATLMAISNIAESRVTLNTPLNHVLLGQLLAAPGTDTLLIYCSGNSQAVWGHCDYSAIWDLVAVICVLTDTRPQLPNPNGNH